MDRSGKDAKDEEVSLVDLLDEFKRGFVALGEDVRAGVEKLAEEMEYRFDKEFGKQLARHPELYAELKRTGKQIRKTAKTFLDGLKDTR